MNSVDFGRYWPYQEGQHEPGRCECVAVERVSPQGLDFRISDASTLTPGTSGVCELVSEKSSFGFVPIRIGRIDKEWNGHKVFGQIGGEFSPIFASSELSPETGQGDVRWCVGPDLVLHAKEAGVLRTKHEKRIVVCPCCMRLPQISRGCSVCGDSNTSKETLFHHFKCALVAPKQDFQRSDGATCCPKCGAGDLLVGVDFDVVRGRETCQSCGHHMDELEMIGHCEPCSHVFKIEAAPTMRIPTYHVRRANWEEISRTVVKPKSFKYVNASLRGFAHQP